MRRSIMEIKSLPVSTTGRYKLKPVTPIVLLILIEAKLKQKTCGIENIMSLYKKPLVSNERFSKQDPFLNVVYMFKLFS
jgi:hypothetical protein